MCSKEGLRTSSWRKGAQQNALSFPRRDFVKSVSGWKVYYELFFMAP